MPKVGPLYNYQRVVNDYNPSEHLDYNDTKEEGKTNPSAPSGYRRPFTPHWSTNFNTDGTLKTDVSFCKDVISKLRENAKALIRNFNVPTDHRSGPPLSSPAPDAVTLPSFTAAGDSNLDAEDPVTNVEFNGVNGVIDATDSPSYSGLLDDMVEGNVDGLLGTNPTAVSKDIKITRAKINEISAKIEAAKNYQNYANHANSGYCEYNNGYINHSNYYTGDSRGWICHRNHSNYQEYGNTYVNYSEVNNPVHWDYINPYSNVGVDNYTDS